MENILKNLQKENVMIMLYTYGIVEGEVGCIDVPKSSRMVFQMKDAENKELLNLFIETGLKVSKKEKSHLCYTVVENHNNTLIQVLQEYGFQCATCEKSGIDKETNAMLFIKEIALTEEEKQEIPTPFDGIDCFMLWGTQGISYKIGKGTNATIRAFDKGEFLD